MAKQKYLVSVGDVTATYDDGGDNVWPTLFTAKTLLDNTFDFTSNMIPVKGGAGAQLIQQFYYGSEFKITMTDCRWNPAALMFAGGDMVNGAYGFTDRFAVFAQRIKPMIVSLTITADIHYVDDVTGFIGTTGQLQITVPRAMMDGNFSLSLASGGTSNTPITATALAYHDYDTIQGDLLYDYPIYAFFKEDYDDWTLDLESIVIEDGGFTLNTGETKRLYAVGIGCNNRTQRILQSGIIGWELSNPPDGTVISGSAGVITAGGNAGTGTVRAYLLRDGNVDATCEFEVI